MDSTRITDVHCLRMRLPFDHGAAPPRFAGRPRTTLDSALIRVRTSDGTVGWGEAYGADLDALHSIVTNRVGPLAVGQDALSPGLMPSLQRPLHLMGRSGPVVHALSGLEIALWDLRGKYERLPVHRLLGGARRQRIPAYASLLQYYDDADAIRRNVEAALQAGYRSVKLHETTAAAAALARDLIGPAMPLMVDVNCAWSPAEAEDMIARIKPSAPLWVEEPVWPPENLAALSRLRERTGVAIAAGENASSLQELVDAVERHAVDFVQPSAIKSGGIAALSLLSGRCSTGPVRFAPHSACFGPGFLATVHALAAHPRDEAIERIWCSLRFVPYGRDLPIEGGHVPVPEGPGLGADPDSELLDGPFIT